MEINNISNLTFTSAFKFGKISDDCYKELNSLVNSGSKKIFNSVAKSGDIVIVNHSCYDERVKNFINKKSLKFQYFPNIKFSDKLTKDTLKGLIIRNKNKNDVIKDSFVLNAHIVKENIIRGKCIFKHLKYILRTLRLNVDEPKIGIAENGLPKIRDNSKERTIYVSSNYGSKYYVYVKPDSSNQSSSRYLLYGNGRKLIKEYKSPEEILKFKNLSCIVRD